MGSKANTAATDNGHVQPSVEERLALIERVAASEHFKRSNRLHDFLLYVGRESLKEGGAEIHEQEIGEHVFGRPTTYDRSQDNIVRVNATELRKRIELYFANEGAQEPLLLEIPRGGYTPVFHPRLPEAKNGVKTAGESLPIAAEQTQEVAHAGQKGFSGNFSRRQHLLWAMPCLALAIACLVLFLQNRKLQESLHPWEGKPALEAFWSGFLSYHQETDLVLPDDSVSVIQDITQVQVSLPDYLSHNYMRQIQASNLSNDRKVDLDQIFHHNLVTYGGVRAAEQVMALNSYSRSFELKLSRYYTADSIKLNNVVLIGGRKATPWVHLFDDQLNFITDYDTAHSEGFINNRNPKTGEQATYKSSYYPNSFIGYSVVAYLPNPSHTGNAIILAGTDSDATDAAAEFLTSEEQMENFRKTLHVDKFPYFEVLLKTSRLSGTSLGSEMVAYRTH